MTAGVRRTQAQVVAILNARGYDVIGQFKNNATKLLVECREHKTRSAVFPGNLFKGQRLPCCGNAGRRLHRTGRVMSDETKAKLSKLNAGNQHPHFGRPRSALTRERVSLSLKAAAAKSVDYAINKARTGKCHGQPGIFYIAKLADGTLKFGSTVRLTIARRFEALACETRQRCFLVLCARVPDAGAYEADMMERYREHWLHGERFRDWLTHPPA